MALSGRGPRTGFPAAWLSNSHYAVVLKTDRNIAGEISVGAGAGTMTKEKCGATLVKGGATIALLQEHSSLRATNGLVRIGAHRTHLQRGGACWKIRWDDQIDLLQSGDPGGRPKIARRGNVAAGNARGDGSAPRRKEAGRENLDRAAQIRRVFRVVHSVVLVENPGVEDRR